MSLRMAAIRPFGSTLPGPPVAWAVPPLQPVRPQPVQMPRVRRNLDRGENLLQVQKLEPFQASRPRSADARSSLSRDSELDHTRQRCAELERLVHEQTPHRSNETEGLRRQLAAYAVEIDLSRSAENDLGELRKQLAAYSEEIDSLRKERSSVELTLKEAREEATEAQSALQRALLTIQRLQTEQPQQEQQQHLQERQEQKELQQLKEMQELADANASLRKAYAQLQEEHAAQASHIRELLDTKRDVVRFQTEQPQQQQEQQKHFQQLEEPQQLQQQIQELTDANVSLREAYAQLQEEHEEAVHFRDELAIQRDFDTDVKSGCSNPVEAPRRKRWQINDMLDYARALSYVSKEQSLQKVNNSNQKREGRNVIVSAPEMLLRWAKGRVGCGVIPKSVSQLDLRDVVRIDYGISARAFLLHADSVLPWLCFSLFTTARSFDFTCPDEESAQYFLLALSQLCSSAVGRISSRAGFHCAKGWCKIQHHCIRKGKPFLHVILDQSRKGNRAHMPSRLF